MHEKIERFGRRAGLAALLAALGSGRLAAQFPLPDPGRPGRDRDRLPNGSNRDLLLIKKDHEKTLEDVAEIRRLAEEVESELEENTEHVVSLTLMEKMERIEELAKDARKRMRRSY